MPSARKQEEKVGWLPESWARSCESLGRFRPVAPSSSPPASTHLCLPPPSRSLSKARVPICTDSQWPLDRLEPRKKETKKKAERRTEWR
jgi:hypothetical protein